MNPTRLSHELRKGRTPDLKRRRWIVGLSLLGAAMGQVVSLYQMGIVPRLPDPPRGPFDATKVDASDYAYSRFRSPDGLAMVTTYAVTAWLAGAGGEERARRLPFLPLAMGLKTAYDTLNALELAREEWRDNKALCQYCQVATLASAASVALAAPEALRAARELRGRG